MKTSHFVIMLFLLFLSSGNGCNVNRSTGLNLDFEKVDLKTYKATGWDDSEYGFKISVDHQEVYKGKYALKIESVTDKYSVFNGGAVMIRIDNVHSARKIRLSGFIKNENTDHDTCGLYIIYNPPDYKLGKELSSKNFIGTHNWQEYSIEVIPVDEPDYFIVGVRMKGSGKIWVDNLRLFIDDKEVFSYPSPDRFKASKNEINWLKNHSVPIKTVHAENGFKDLEPLREYLRSARIVALGENTHGTSEIFEMKHRLLEFLSSEMGFNIFSIESTMFNTDLLNNFIETGKGDPKALLPTLTRAWNTQEVLDMIQWMKKHNESAVRKLQFTGFDMTDFYGSLRHLADFANLNNKTLKTLVDSLSLMLLSPTETGIQEEINKQNFLKTRKCDQILSCLENAKNQSTADDQKNELNVLIQNANIIHQYTDLYSNINRSAMRDRFMAENISWILENNPNSKIVLWAHNEHISKQSEQMGGYLSKKYGDQYYSIGFLTNEGKYTASTGSILSTENKLIKGLPGSFEYNFSKTGLPILFFDLNSINKNEQNSLWLDKKLYQRTIGAEAADHQFWPASLRKKFDGVIFINSTSASKTFLPTDVPLSY